MIMVIERFPTRPAVPLTVLTGFLGAGKTTLLNRILNGDHGLRIAVLVNDFGSINIDANLVTGIEDDVVSLANGCVCCAIRDDLIAAVLAVIDRPEAPECILLEASGVADPAGISLAFIDGDLQDRIRLDSVTCIVDAEQVFAVPEMMELKIRQMAFADMIILNKVDLVDRAQIDKITTWLESRFHRYRLVEASHGNAPLEILLAAGRFDPLRGDIASRDACRDLDCGHDHSHKRDHSHEFDTWSYETDAPLSLEMLRDVAARLPATIYRAKGIVASVEEPTRRSILQVVGKRADISPGNQWGAVTQRTRIVVIGATGGLDEAALCARFDSCHAARPECFEALTHTVEETSEIARLEGAGALGARWIG